MVLKLTSATFSGLEGEMVVEIPQVSENEKEEDEIFTSSLTFRNCNSKESSKHEIYHKNRWWRQQQADSMGSSTLSIR